MSDLRATIDGMVNWVAANARSFSYMLPDSMELALYLCIVAYFTVQLVQPQA